MGKLISHDRKANSFFRAQLKDNLRLNEKKRLEFKKVLDQRALIELKQSVYQKELDKQSKDKARAVSERR